MTEYYVVEKDIEENIGFIHKGSYTSKKKAQKWANLQKKQLGEYYEFFVAEMDE